MHKRQDEPTKEKTRTKVKISSAKLRKGGLEGFSSMRLVWVIELGGQENLSAGDTRCLDALTDFLLVTVGSSSVDVLVSVPQRELYSVLDCTWSRFPGS